MIAHTTSWPHGQGRLPALALAMLILLAFWLAPANADEGHDHGDAPAFAPATEVLPRFTAVSEDFELVGMLTGQQLTLYLDRTATNEPVREASIELDIGGRVVRASPTPEGAFLVALPQALPEGSTPITATVIVGGTSDLLAGDIDINDSHEDEDGLPHAHRRLIAGWGLGALVLLGVLALLWRRRSRGASRTGGAA